MTSGRKRAVLVILLFLAVVVPRLGAAAYSLDGYFARGDLNWDHMARNLLDGKGLLIPGVGAMSRPQYAHKTPIYAFLLAGIYSTLGRHAPAVIGVQILFALVATWLVLRLGTRLTGRSEAGWIAAFATALYPPLVVHDVQLMESTLYRGEVVLLTLLVFEAGLAPRPRTLLLTGLVAGVTVLTRTTIVFFLPLAAVWLLVMWGRRIPGLLPAIAGAVCVFLAVLAPWFVRNWELFGRLHLVTGGGRSIWIGTSGLFLEEFPDRSVDGVERTLWRTLPREERTRLRGISEIQLDAELMAKARADLAAHPGRLGPLVLLKAGAAFSPVLNPRVDKDPFDKRWGDRKRLVYLLSYLPLLVVGGLGLVWMLLRRLPAGSLVLLQFLAFLVFSMIFWAHSRHRYFLDPFLAVTAAGLLVGVVDRVRGREETAEAATDPPGRGGPGDDRR